MKRTVFSKAEQRFLLLTAVVCVLCVGLAFRFAAPITPEVLPGSTDSTPLLQLVRVDLNTAGRDALCTLPGVGPKRAEAILSYREEYGAFRTVSDAALVPGLTEEVVASWAEMAYVS